MNVVTREAGGRGFSCILTVAHKWELGDLETSSVSLQLFCDASPPPRRYFLWKLVTVVLIQTAWQDSFTWPLLIFLLTCCIYPLASSCAHTFSTMSARARHICFFFDYGALSLYSLGVCTLTEGLYQHP